jgi:hypothetical protein
MRRWIIPLVTLAGLTGLVIACYGRAIFEGEQFAYRDAGHYYYPLHQRIQAEWDAGRWPLWEPEENGGMPLLGDPTAAVLYPGKLVFALFAYPLAARLYIMGHTLLAFAAMIALLRHWGTSWVGSALGAIAFAFGGPIVFQYCNVIFLVGAAWVPLGFRAVDRWLRLGRRIALAELAIVVAMETLGGDLESAYVTGLCAAGYAAGLAWGRRTSSLAAADRAAADPQGRRARRLLTLALPLVFWVVATLAAAQWAPALRTVATVGPRQLAFPWAPWIGPLVAVGWGLAGLVLVARWRRLRRAVARPVLAPMLFGLVAAACVAAAVTAAQLLPVIEFIRQSGRAADAGPHDIYPFSLHPARVVELVWPNVYGNTFHGNTLWLGSFAPRDPDVKLWVPTLYLGGLTMVLALGGLGLRPEGQHAPWRRWMATVAALSLLSSFGEYSSPIWLARLVSSAIAPVGAQGSFHNGDGGIYWLLATALPGFGQFRYPSKLLTFTVLGLASLAAQGWDALISGDPRDRRRMAAWSAFLLGLTLAALAVSAIFRGAFLAWLDAQPLASVFGPFDARGALVELQLSLSQSALVLAIALVLILRLASRLPVVAAALALAVSSADLAVANARVVTTVPQSVMDEIPEVLSSIKLAERERPASGPYRVHRVPIWNPMGWGETASPDRLREIVEWQRETLGPKYGINLGISYTLSIGVAQINDYERFFGGFYFKARDRAARVLGAAPGSELVVYPRRSFDLWNTRYFVLPYSTKWDHEYRGIASFIDHTERIDPPPDAFFGPEGRQKEIAWANRHDYQVRHNLNAYPRAWIVHDARSMPGPGHVDRDRRMEEILFSNDLAWPDPARIVYDPRRVVWLEDSVLPELAAYLTGGTPSAGEDVRVVRHESDRVEIVAVLERPGVVVLADAAYPGWTLSIDGRSAPVYHANRMMRGAAVEAGLHRLVYTFRPASFRIGLAVSGLGLAALVLLALWSILPNRATGMHAGNWTGA